MATMISVNIHEAKARLSELIRQVEKGEIVQICRRNEAIAEIRVTAKKSKKERPIGLHKGLFKVSSSFFDPLPEDLLKLYNGEDN